LAILLGYPYLLKRLYPKQTAEPPKQETGTPAQEKAPEQNQRELPLAENPKESELFLQKPAEPEVTHFENDLFEIDFSNLGGTVLRLAYKGEKAPFPIDAHIFYEQELTQPGLFGVRLTQSAEDLTRSFFTKRVLDARAGAVEFVYEKPGDYRLVKRFVVGDKQPVIFLELTLENLSGKERTFPLELGFDIVYELTQKDMAATVEGVVQGEKIVSADIGKISNKGFSVAEPVLWAGVMTKYYALLVKPGTKAAWAGFSSQKKTLDGILRMPPLAVPPHGTAQEQYFVYAGPKRYETLKSFDMGFEGVLSRGFFGLLKVWFLAALKFFYRYTHNYGWCIILLTCVIKLIFTPLTHMSFQSMKKMQALQPKLKSLQERYKNDPQKLNHEMMQLYKRNKVNPMGGCLPMLLQIPIFIAFYQVLNDAIELKGAGFAGWIHDLAAPDKLYTFSFSLPLIGDSFNLLPLLMIGSMVWQQKLTPQTGGTPEQQKMMTFMPLIFGFFFYNMPSGLVLYWLINNVLSIIHQVFIKKIVVVLHPDDEA
jgi:YidC/Oxa1 family membrane protein insertase